MDKKKIIIAVVVIIAIIAAGLLILGINIYKGKMAALNGIPFKKKDRKFKISIKRRNRE